MTNPTQSLINFGSIDATYPVAGQDNNSQGFRDNFGVIKTGLSQASSEISALQTNAAFVNANNNFGGNSIVNAKYNQFYGTFLPLGTVNSNQDINLQNGPIQAVTLAQNVTLTFRNWPASGSYATARLFISSDGAGVRRPTLQTASGNALKYDVDFPKLPNGTPGIEVGGEKVTSITVTNPGTGYTDAVAIGFSGGSQQASGTTATATADYKVVSATVVGGYPGNGYAVNDTITLNANTDVVLSVSSLNLTFEGNVSNGNPTISAITSFLNLGTSVAISGNGIPPGTLIGSVNVNAGTATMVDSNGDPVNATSTITGVTITYESPTGPIGALTVSKGGVFSLPIVGSYDTSALIGVGYGARIVLSFGINTINVTYGGNGYTTTPAVTFTGGGGVNSQATAVITSNTISNPKVIEASTYDGGTTVFVKYIGEFN